MATTNPQSDPQRVMAPIAPAMPDTASAASTIPSVPNGAALFAQTHDFAAQVFARVSAEYLDFRRKQYHEDNPSLTTVPPKLDHADQTASGKVAEQALRFTPKEVRIIPFVHDLLDTLQWTVDINTLTDRERTSLHNITMIFLNGVQGGVHPWFVQWMLQAAYALQHATHPNYYLAFPWHGLLYKAPSELVALDNAVRTGDIPTLQDEVQKLADHLVKVLRDPLHTQPDLAFSGVGGERRRMMFNIKVTAALAIGAYLAAETVNNLLHPPRESPPPTSLVDFPQELEEHLLPEDADR